MDVIDYGVCRLALVSIRKEPRDAAEQVTQLLFGDHYEVTGTSEDKRWLRIVIYADRAEGWLDARQHPQPFPGEYFDQINRKPISLPPRWRRRCCIRRARLTIVMEASCPSPILNSSRLKSSSRLMGG